MKQVIHSVGTLGKKIVGRSGSRLSCRSCLNIYLLLSILLFSSSLAAQVNKQLYLSDGQTLDRIDPVNTADVTLVSTAPLDAGQNATETFVQSPQLCAVLNIVSGQPITVQAYTTVMSGTMPASPSISATLRYGSTTIATLVDPTYNSSTGLLTWTTTLGSDVNVPALQSIALDITTAQPGVAFTIDYDSQADPSLVELPVSTFINVESLAVYDAPYPGGTLLTSSALDDTVYIRTTVSDPFGFDDITGLDLTIGQPGGGSSTFSAASVTTVGCSRIYEYAYTIPFSTCGDFSILATAMEGFEDAVTDTEVITLSAGTPSITATVTPINSCDTPGMGAITVSDPSGGYGGPWEVSINTTDWFTVDTGSPYTFTGLASGAYTVSIREAGFVDCEMVLDNVMIAVENSLSAGEDNDTLICRPDPFDFPLVSLQDLLVNADTGGVWTPVSGDVPTGPDAVVVVFSGESEYLYIHPATNACPADTAVIEIFSESQRYVYLPFLPDAPIIASAICEGESTPLDLIQLGSSYTTYQAGDYIEQIDGPVMVDISDPFSVDFSSAPPGLYRFRYFIPPTAICPGTSGLFRVLVYDPIEAGSDGTIQLCEGETAPQSLFDIITGGEGEILPAIESSSGVTNLSEGTDGVNGNGIQFDAVGDEVVITFPDFTPTNTLVTVHTIARGGGSSSRTLSFTQSFFAPPSDLFVTEDVVHTVEDSVIVTTFPLISPNSEVGMNSITISLTDSDGGRVDLDHISIVGSWMETGAATSGVTIGDGTAVDFSTVAPGTYEFTYTTPANDVCAVESATATVTIQDQLSAGLGSFFEICEINASSINLEDELFGEDPGGIWTQTGGPPADISDPTDVDLSELGSNTVVFTYTQPANGLCPSDQSSVEITLGMFYEAGVGSTIEICEGETTPVDLASLLTGADPLGGFNQQSGPTDFGGLLGVLSTLDFSAALPGTYVFQYLFDFADPICGFDDPAIITVIVTDQLEAGADNSDQINEGSSSNYDLTALLSGADPGGAWMQTSGAALDISNPADVDFSAAAPGVYTFTYTQAASGVCPQDQATFNITVEQLPPVAIIQPKVMLQSALLGTNDMLMNDDLRQDGSLPSVEPYTSLGFSHVSGGGGESVADMSILTNDNGPNSIVDWIFIELRDFNDPATVLATRSGLLQRDGDIVDVDGASPLTFSQSPMGDYYVAIRHRNHLGVMTASPIALDNTGLLLDFTNSAFDMFNTAPVNDGIERADVNGMKALWAGNTTADDRVVFAGQNNDKTPIFNEVDQAAGNILSLQTYILSGYQLGDLNLDGKSIFAGQNNDVTTIFDIIDGYPGNVLKLQTYVLLEQLP